MNLPRPEAFQISTLDGLVREARRLNVELPVASDTAVLGEPVAAGTVTIPNRLCVQPMEGHDATADGAPGEWTFRRYRRYAEGGFGLIWMEATAVDGPGRSHPRQLGITRRNVSTFAGLVSDIKQAARNRWGRDIIVFLQLSRAGRGAEGQALADDELDRLQDAFVEAGCLAAEAGFDGLDVKACHGDLCAGLLGAFTRPGRYGGARENRGRFLLEVTGKLRRALPGVVLASRVSFPGDGEAVALAGSLHEAGIQVLNVSEVLASGEGAAPDMALPHIVRFARLMDVTRAIRKALPAMPVLGGGYSWFRQFLPEVAAGAVRHGGVSLIGVGRAALAYPELAGDLWRTGRLDPDTCCLDCSACTQLIKDGGRTGCPVMDSESYGGEYRHQRQFAVDHLREEAGRCRACEPAPCRAACPARIDVPAFLKAFAEDDTEASYAILRRANVFPESCSLLCPAGQHCEGRCVLNTLEGNPIPIHDIQYAVAWMARQRGLAGVGVAAPDNGRRVAVIGGGPAGMACAVTLIERGHRVVVYDRAARLGGTPEHLIPANRFSGACDEMMSVIYPALRAGRLTLKFGKELGAGLTLEELRAGYDAVFLATGVWGGHSLGHAEGVVDAVTFLKQARAGERTSVPEQVIVLAGGDCAMDSAVVARELGAVELTLVYAGLLSDMHWHMPDSWFRTRGVQFMMATRPLGYQVDDRGRMTGLKVRFERGGGPGCETVLKAGLVIEAMGLEAEAGLVAALGAGMFTGRGLLKTSGPGSFFCGVPGVFAGGGVINGGASVVQCVAEGMTAGREIAEYLGRQ